MSIELLTTYFHKKNEERIPKVEEIWNNLFIFRESMSWIAHKFQIVVKFIYSEKVSKFCKISTVDLSCVVTVKSTVEILQNIVAFSEYINFTSVPIDEAKQTKIT